MTPATPAVSAAAGVRGLGHSAPVLTRLGRSITLHPWRYVVAWVLVVAGALLPALGVVGDGLFPRLTSGQASVPGPARTGADLLERAAPSGPTVFLQLDDVDPAAPVVQRALGAALADVSALPDVASVAAPLLPGPGVPELPPGVAQSLTARDGTAVLLTATLDADLEGDAADAARERVEARLEQVADQVPGSRGRVASPAGLDEVFSDLVERDLRTGEAIALPASLLVMVVVFGGLLAAGVPLVGALASIAGGLGALTAFTHVTDVDASVVNVVTVLGLGLCIDYGLLVVSRYREELRARAGGGEAGGGEAVGAGAVDVATDRVDRAVRDAAVVATVAGAGRTVVFSAVTIAVSLSGLLLFRADVLRSMGLAAASVVALALAVAITLVPALLVVSGARLTRPGLATRVPGLRAAARRLGDVAPAEGFFSALARRVQRRPGLALAAVVVVLGVLAAPATQIDLRSDGIELLPVDNPSRVFFTDLDSRFPAAASPAVTVVAQTDPQRAAGYAAELADLAGLSVGEPTPVAEGLSTIAVRADDADSAVAAVRGVDAAFPVHATGQAAATADFRDELAQRAPWAIALVALATVVLLFLMTGSLLVPATALVANALSLGAALGVLTLVFQDGWLEGLLGFTSNGGVESFAAPLTLAFGFGLAMDYEVFLLARVLDARRAGLTTDAAVVAGLQGSGRIITSAAAIIVIVFAGFVGGSLLAIKEVGLGLAVAVAIDASLVRMVAVPAVMTLLGEANWWAPAPLRALHERFGISEGAPEAERPREPATV